jgi:histidine phosphotransferase ChpT
MGDTNAADDSLLLAEAMATRLCHDLSGHVNAVAGAIELLRDDPASGEDAINIAHEASIVLVRRLRLLRAAWGSGGADMTVCEFHRLTSDALGPAVRVDLDGLESAGCFNAAAARLALNVMLLGAESLPRGGLVEMAGEPARDVVVRISGPQAAWPRGLAAMFADPAQARGSLRSQSQTGAARALQAPLTALIAHDAGLRISVLMGADSAPPAPLLLSMRPAE